MSSAERFDRYRSALAALDELPTRLAHERAAATAAYEQAASTAAAIRSTVQAQAEALREQVDQLLSQGRALAASMGEDGDLPAELEASGPPTDLSIARAALEQLAAAVEAVEAHRSLARRQRLDEARARERAAEEATARRVAAEEAERRAAAAREEQARAERFRLALRRARIGAAVVSLGTVVVAGPALAAGPRLGGVVLAVGGSAAWLVHRALEPHPGP